MRISYEAIYQALFIQGRGALQRELVAFCPTTGNSGSAPPPQETSWLTASPWSCRATGLS